MLAELRLVVCDDSQKALQLVNSKSSLEYIVVIESINDEVRRQTSELGIKLLSLEELKEIGRKHLKNPVVRFIFSKLIKHVLKYFYFILLAT